MATEVERLVATLEANIKGYENNLKKALSTTNKQLGAIEKRAKAMQGNLSATLGRGFAQLAAGVSVGALAAQAYQAANAYVDMQNALRTTGLSAAEVASTFDDLYKIAQRQGTAIQPLVGLYASLARSQTELGVSSQAITGFTENVALALRVGGTSAQQASGALLQLSQALAGGVVRAEEFNSIVEGAPTILRAVAAGLQEAGGSVGKLRQLVNEGAVSSRAFFEAFQAGSKVLDQMAASSVPTVSQGLTRVSNAFTNLVGEVNKATGATDNAAMSLNAIADYIDALPDKLSGASTAWADFKTRVNEASASMLEFMGIDTSAAGLRKMGLDPGMPSLGRGDRNGRRVDDAFNITPDAALAAALAKIKPVSTKDYPVAGGKAKGGGSGSREKLNEYEREIEAIKRRTEALDIEAGTIGRSTYEAEKYKATQELLNAAKEAGVKITDEERAKIDALATQHAEAAKRVEDLQKAYEAAQEQAQFFGDLITGALTDLIANGASAEDVAKRLAAALAEAAIQAALLGKGPLANLFGGGGGGGLLGLLGGLFGGKGLFGSASGGVIPGGKPRLVGETGPEVILPAGPSRVVPNRMLRNGGGPTITFAPVTQVAAGVTAPELRAILNERDQQWRRSLPALVKDAAGRRAL